MPSVNPSSQLRNTGSTALTHAAAAVSATKDTTTLNRESPSNWLASASKMRKKAALNTTRKPSANSKLTPKECRTRDAAFVFPVDLSGIFVHKKSSTWYSLDVKGENPSFVSGMPYMDPVFNEIRVWETLEERKNAISHQLRSVDEK
jgi:hypothetical protein